MGEIIVFTPTPKGAFVTRWNSATYLPIGRQAF
jgi:hypothetical protein